MNNLKIFENAEFGQIRTAEVDGEPWFVGKDVAEALGYKNTKDALISHVSEEDRRIFQRSGFATIENNIPKNVFPVNFVNSDIPNRGLTAINESGLYALIFGSKLESAKRFKHWVTSEVLPAIRKHGAYAVDELLNNPEMAIKAFTALKEEREKNKRLQTDVDRMKPKEIFADAVSASKTSILIGDLAKILKQNGINTGQNRLFETLRKDGYLIKQKGSNWNMPTQRAMEMELFEIKESTHIDGNGCNVTTKTTKVTGKGQQYFINRYLKIG